AQKIRTQYMEKEPSELDELRALDAEVKRPANVLAYTLGGVSSLVMGAGMSLVMTDVGVAIGMASALVPGIIIGTLGLLAAIANYPIYKKHLERRRKQYAEEIMALSEKILNK
ncbi:MAG: dihydropteridine reductase, partial [Clostridia bacterium]|nr:dihydropteridine reductase [Clostridia bacterium]